MTGQGIYDGEPSAETVDGHTSSVERFTDSGFHVVPWSAELAVRAAGVNVRAPRAEQVQQLRDAIDDDALPDEAVDALVAGGWTELADGDAGAPADGGDA